MPPNAVFKVQNLTPSHRVGGDVGGAPAAGVFEVRRLRRDGDANALRCPERELRRVVKELEQEGYGQGGKGAEDNGDDLASMPTLSGMVQLASIARTSRKAEVYSNRLYILRLEICRPPQRRRVQSSDRRRQGRRRLADTIHHSWYGSHPKKNAAMTRITPATPTQNVYSTSKKKPPSPSAARVEKNSST